MTDPEHQEFRRVFEAAKKASVAQLLFKCARILNEQAIQRVAERRSVELRPAHTALFPHIDVTQGTRLTELASALGVSKQAVGQLVDDLERAGMLERQPDPDDGRAKRVCYTDAGRAGLFEGLEVLQQLEAELAEGVGQRRFRQLHAALLALEQLLESPA